MDFASLFTGIGGFDLGFERAGASCMAQVEIDPACNRVLGRRWENVSRHEDVREVKASDLGPAELVCGGFPCQDLSVAGRRAGLAGERSGLFYEFMRVVADLAPRWVLVENVPGLLSSSDGRDMGAILGTLGELGYGWAYRVLDAQFFGVAQRRRRVFIVGCLGDSARAASVLFESESCEGHPAPSREAGARVAAPSEGGPAYALRSGRLIDDSHGNEGNIVAATLNSGGNDGGFRTEPGEHLVADTLRSHPRPGSNSSGALIGFNASGGGSKGLSTIEDGAPPVTASHGDAGAVFAVRRSQQSSNGWGVNDETSYTLDSTATQAVAAGATVRRLTPRECERLQGFPDDWTAGETDSTRYRMLGNAVCVPVAEWIGRRIMEVAA